MPNRILRDYTDSPRFDGLSAEAERLFVRLLMKADDFGRFHANPKLVKAACFPLAEDLRANTVAAWLTELSDRQLVFCYTSGTGMFLALPKFRQRARAETSKYPPPDGQPPDWMPSDDGQVTVIRQSPAAVFGGVFEDGGGGECGTPAPLPRGCARRRPQAWPSSEQVAKSIAATSGVDPDFAATFWHHYEGQGYWPQGSFASAMKSKQGFKAQDLADKAHVAAATRQTEREASATQHRTMQL